MDMENSVCESPKQQQRENPDDDFDDIVQSLQNLDLRGAIDEYIKLSNCSTTINMNQISSDLQTQWKSAGSDHESIWGYRFFTYEGEGDRLETSESSIPYLHYNHEHEPHCDFLDLSPLMDWLLKLCTCEDFHTTNSNFVNKCPLMHES
ncbi:hypothetical protein OROGR_003362 [Orobanche gracilis]